MSLGVCAERRGGRGLAGGLGLGCRPPAAERVLVGTDLVGGWAASRGARLDEVGVWEVGVWEVGV